MIDAGPSLKAAAGLAGPALVSYLTATGWSARPSRVDGISIFTKKIEGSARPIEFILPVKSGFVDEQRRIADALRTMAELEGRSLSQIAEDIRRAADLDGMPEQSVESPVGAGFSDFERMMIDSSLESHIGGKQILFRTIGHSGTHMIEVIVMVDQSGRYEALVRDAENGNQPVRFLVEGPSDNPGTGSLERTAKGRGDPE